MAHLFRVDLQSGAAQGFDDEIGDAGQILAQPSRSRTHSFADPGREAGGGRNGRTSRNRTTVAAPARRGAQGGCRGGCRDHIARRCSRRGAGLPAVPALRIRDAGGVRRGSAERGGDVRRRAAGRPGGPCGQAVRRSGRAGVRQGARQGRDRPAAGLCDERGQALQIRAARQEAHPLKSPMRERSRRAASGSTSSANSCGPS